MRRCVCIYIYIYIYIHRRDGGKLVLIESVILKGKLQASFYVYVCKWAYEI